MIFRVPVSAVSRKTISMIISEAMSSMKVKDWSLLNDLHVFFEREWCLLPTIHSSIHIWSKRKGFEIFHKLLLRVYYILKKKLYLVVPLSGVRPFSTKERKCKIHNKEHALAGKKRTFGSANSSAASIVNDMLVSETMQVTGGTRPELAES